MRGEAVGGAFCERIIGAVCDLVRGYDDADGRASGRILGPRDAGSLGQIMAGAITALLRVMVLAFAADRGLFTGEEGALGALHADLTQQRRRGAALEQSSDAWARLTAMFHAVHAARSGALFDPARFPFLERDGPSDAAVLAMLDRLLVSGGERIRWAEVDVEDLGAAYEAMVGLHLRMATADTRVLLPAHVGVDLEALLAVPALDRGRWLEAHLGAAVRPRLATALSRAESTAALAAVLERRASPRWTELVRRGALFVEPGDERRRTGAHYTPRVITQQVVEQALGPLLASTDPLALRICDPAMGSGAFLVEACRQLGDRLAAAGIQGARRLVAERCLHGVDRDPIAVDVARVSLWLVAEARDRPLSFVDLALRTGDALVGEGSPDGPSRDAVDRLCHGAERAVLHWPAAFPEVFERGRGGFDAFVGNPPWVAYVGRAAQPLPADLFEFYRRGYPSFHAYRTLHGLFVYRAASLLRPGGRLGLVVPTSVSDLAGYAPTRRAHDTLCEVDAELPDFGDAFPGVFQPAMGLYATRRPAPLPPGEGGPWRVARDDLDAVARALLDRLATLPPLPAACFGERGYQTSGSDDAKIAIVGAPAPPFVVPIREGADVRAFRTLPPRLHLDPSNLGSRLRRPEEWRAVGVLIRQTARFPIAALADGLAFRNSILAGFSTEACDHFALCAWLNAAPIRWLHYMRYRDARQGMPQVKIGHLRSIPRVPGEHLAELQRLGEALGARNGGASTTDQRALDDAAGRALGLSDGEQALIAAWAAKSPTP